MQRHQVNDLDWLGATFERFASMCEQLLLPLSNLVCVQLELVAKLCHRLVLTQSCQRHLGFECWRMRAPRRACRSLDP